MDEARLHDAVSRLTMLYEAPRAEPWAVTDAPEPFIKAQLKGIVGLRLTIMRDDHFADEIIHLLVGTAVANCVHAEHMSQLRNDPFRADAPACNLAVRRAPPDILNSGQEIPLTFEQACNKIIHAKHIVPDGGNPAENPLTSEVKLRGHLGKSAWSAYLNIPQHVRASILNFRDRV